MAHFHTNNGYLYPGILPKINSPEHLFVWLRQDTIGYQDSPCFWWTKNRRFSMNAHRVTSLFCRNSKTTMKRVINIQIFLTKNIAILTISQESQLRTWGIKVSILCTFFSVLRDRFDRSLKLHRATSRYIVRDIFFWRSQRSLHSEITTFSDSSLF